MIKIKLTYKHSRYPFNLFYPLLQRIPKHTRFTLTKTYSTARTWALLTTAKCHKNGQYKIYLRHQYQCYQYYVYQFISLQYLLTLLQHTTSLLNHQPNIIIIYPTHYFLNLCGLPDSPSLFSVAYYKCYLYIKIFYYFMTYPFNNFSTSNGFYCMWT